MWEVILKMFYDPSSHNTYWMREHYYVRDYTLLKLRKFCIAKYDIIGTIHKVFYFLIMEWIKVYVGCSLRNAPEEFRQSVRDFKETIRTNFHILDFMGVLDWSVPDSEIRAFDLKQVEACDLMIAECSYPSLWLGMEIQHALAHKKSLFIIAHIRANVSSMVLGIPEESATIMRYEHMNEAARWLEKKYSMHS